MRRHRATVALVFSSIVACGGPQRPSGVLAETISVLGPGAEPRQRLHYHFVEHVPERMEVTVKLRVNGAITNTVLETGRQRTDFPAIKMTVRVEVTALDTDGTATMNTLVEDVAVLDDVIDPAVHKSIDGEAIAMKGFAGAWRVSPSGRITDITPPAKLPVLRALLASIANTLRDNAVVFPDQRLGVGASWKVTSKYVVSGVTYDRTATYRLKALGESSATLDAQVSMNAGSQALSVEPTATTRLTSATSNATSEIVVPFGSLVATATSQGTSEINLLIVRGHQRLISSVQTEQISSVKSITSSAPQP